MARRIIWTEKAEFVFATILKFYFERNGTKTYSEKIDSEIREILRHLINHPFLGRKTNKENVRVLLSGNYKIFYRVTSNEIIIIVIWDTRQNPTDIEI